MSRTLRGAAFVATVIACVGLPRLTHAQPQIILGKMVQVTDPSPGVDATKRLVKVLGKQLPPGDADHVVGCGDPTVDGATIEVIANGATSTDVTYTMPASGWKRIPALITSALIGYKYVNPNATGGPSAVKTALIKRAPNGSFLLQVLLKGKNGAIGNVPPTPGSTGGGIFVIGGGGGCTYCINLGGLAGGQVTNTPVTPPSNKVFKIVATAVAPASEAGCPSPPTTTTTTTTIPACCGAERTTLISSAGSLQVDNFPPFPFPSGVMTVMDTTAPTVGLPTCQHDVHVPSFSVPNFDLQGLNFCSMITVLGCEVGTGVGKGKLWDGGGSTPATVNVSKQADTSDGVCDATYNGSNCNTLGVGSNTLGQIVTTRSPGASSGVRSAIDIPVHSLTWSDSVCSPSVTPGCCPGSTYNPGDGDLLITEFDFILSPTTGVATGAFVDLNADTCKRAGSGFDSAAPGADGPKSLTGAAAAGPCCTVGQSTTIVSVGAGFGGGAPLYDLGFKSTIPNTVSACGSPVGDSCVLTTNLCLGSPSGAFLEPAGSPLE